MDKPQDPHDLLDRVSLVLGQQQGLPSVARLNTLSKRKFIPSEDVQRIKSEYFLDLPKKCDELYLHKTKSELAKRYKFIETAYYDRKFPFNPDPDAEFGRPYSIFWERGGEDAKPSTMLGHLLRQRVFIDNENNKIQYYQTIYKALTSHIDGGGKKRAKTKLRKLNKTKRRKLQKTKRRMR